MMDSASNDACKVSVCIQSFSGLHFPSFRLNTEICYVNFCIQTEKIGTRKYGKAEKLRKIRTKKLRMYTFFTHWNMKCFVIGISQETADLFTYTNGILMESLIKDFFFVHWQISGSFHNNPHNTAFVFYIF